MEYIAKISNLVDIRTLRDIIRYGYDPDNPALIPLWLSREEAILPAEVTLAMRRKCYMDQFNLLLNVISDELVPAHWRCLCLDYIYKPLSGLYRLATGEQDKQHHRQLLYELSVTSRYMAPSLNSPSW